MKAYELLRKAVEHPELYKGKPYRVIKGAVVDVHGNEYNELQIDSCGGISVGYCLRGYISDTTDVEEIEQEASFMEAVNSGKLFRPETWGLYSDDKKYRCLYDNMLMFKGREMLNKGILNGKWFIKT